MKTVRNIALASGAALALALGGVALAQETKQPETTAQPEAQKHEHRGEHRGGHGGEHRHGMHGQHQGC